MVNISADVVTKVVRLFRDRVVFPTDHRMHI